MKKTAIDLMVPGRKLNALVRDRVFNGKSLADYKFKNVAILGGPMTPLIHGLSIRRADFSRSDLEAMFIVQAILQRSPRNEIEFLSHIRKNSDGKVIAWAQFFDTSTGLSPEAEGATLAHAICLAALKFVDLGNADKFVPGTTVFQMGSIDPPEIHVGTIVSVDMVDGGTTQYLVEFEDSEGNAYTSAVPKAAFTLGAVAFDAETVIKQAVRTESNKANTFEFEAEDARGRQRRIMDFLDLWKIKHR